MTERSYTITEIDRMRMAVQKFTGYVLQPMTERDNAFVVEERLRTYMTAGVSPEDVEQHAKEFEERRRQARQG